MRDEHMRALLLLMLAAGLLMFGCTMPDLSQLGAIASAMPSVVAGLNVTPTATPTAHATFVPTPTVSYAPTPTATPLPTPIPTVTPAARPCTDGTQAWQCSQDKPKFCFGDIGELDDNCGRCGCPQGRPVCMISGECVISTPTPPGASPTPPPAGENYKMCEGNVMILNNLYSGSQVQLRRYCWSDGTETYNLPLYADKYYIGSPIYKPCNCTAT